MARVEMAPAGSNGPVKSEPPSERKKLEPVVKGKRKKKSAGKLLMDSFIHEDSQSISEFIVYDVVIPALKDMFFEMITGSSSRILFGDDRGSRTYRGASRGVVVNNTDKYHSSYKTTPQAPPWRQDPREGRKVAGSNRTTTDDVVVSSRQEGLEVLERLQDYLDVYSDVPVAVLNDLTGITSEPMDEKYGWRDLRGADVKYIRGEWVIIMPRAIYLD